MTGIKEAKVALGKWLMDIAKYMTTALLLSSVFTDMNEPIIWYVVLFSALITLMLGLNLIRTNSEESNKKKNKK